MTIIRKFKKPRRLKSIVICTLLFAVVIGSVLGVLLPEDLPGWINTSEKQSFDNGDIIAGRAQVIDGDTIKINKTIIRLFGIDAPEANQDCLDENSISWQCGKKATEHLSSIIENKIIRCEPKDIDQYNRVVAVCRDGETDLNALMVSNGLAVAYKDYSSDYIDEEEDADISSKGIWIGKFEYPWNWRGINRYISSNEKPTGCNIKGNISSSGAKIYHMPDDEYYSVTQINPSKGEKWFCTEKEARAAGWRRSRV
ncbi:MAG: thermonuclease family protein [Emcibacteraceae bacterium]